jgi:hypothetical protein
MGRSDKRKQERILASFRRKAKIDMENWFSTLEKEPTLEEVEAWKNGYITGVNRSSNNIE